MERFTTSDGIGIAYRTWNDDAAGPPVLLHHGFIANAHLNWEITGVIEALGEAANVRLRWNNITCSGNYCLTR